MIVVRMHRFIFVILVESYYSYIIWHNDFKSKTQRVASNMNFPIYFLHFSKTPNHELFVTLIF